jgi:hypothetical protein
MSENNIHEDINGMPVSPEKLRRVMALVNNLLARADHPNTPPEEAKTSRERAEREMARYRLEEAALSVEQKAIMGIKPRKATWDVTELRSEFAQQYRSMANYVINHIGAHGIFTYRHDPDGLTMIIVHVYGFESDLAYGELLWASIRAAFKGQLEPDVDPSLSDEDNVYRLRNAGIERGRIGVLMGWGGEGTNGPGKVTTVFKRACKARNEDPKTLSGKGNNMRTFRRSYAESFADTMWYRMYDLRIARGQNSGELVMANRMEEIMEMFYTDYPAYRPQPRDPNAPQPKVRKQRARKPVERPTNWAAARRGEEAARSVDIGSAGGRRVER